MEGNPAAIIKHGIIALTDEDMQVIIMANIERTNEKNISKFQEVKAGKGEVIKLLHFDEKITGKLANHRIFIPPTEYRMSPLFSALPLQQ